MRIALLIAMLAAAASFAGRPAFAEQAPLDLNATPQPFPAIGQKALAAADRYWGSNPCPNGVSELPASHDTLGASMAAGGCTIFWDPVVAPTTPLEWCTRVIHEKGHLLGLGHNDDPWSAMYGGARVLVLSGPFVAHSSSEGFCYGAGFYRTWKRRGANA